MNLAIRGIDGQISHGHTFHNDRHPDLKADFILANPPFNISNWGGERPEFAVLGGLVPELLCANSAFQHAGRTDIDVQVKLEFACDSVNTRPVGCHP